MPSLRGAATAVAFEDLAGITTGLEPSDDDEAKHLTGNAWKPIEKHTALRRSTWRARPCATCSRKAADQVEFHRRLTERCPPTCGGGARAAASATSPLAVARDRAIRGVLAIVGRDGRTPMFGRRRLRRRSTTPAARSPAATSGARGRRRRCSSATGPISRCRTRSGCSRAPASSPSSATAGCSPRTPRSTHRRRGRAAAAEPGPARERQGPRGARARRGPAQADLEIPRRPGDGARGRRGRPGSGARARRASGSWWSSSRCGSSRDPSARRWPLRPSASPRSGTPTTAELASA